VSHDDQVDVLSLFGRMLASLAQGKEEPPPEKPLVVKPETPTFLELMRNQPKPSSRI
jgi:hypothetical protein